MLAVGEVSSHEQQVSGYSCSSNRCHYVYRISMFLSSVVHVCSAESTHMQSIPRTYQSTDSCKKFQSVCMRARYFRGTRAQKPKCERCQSTEFDSCEREKTSHTKPVSFNSIRTNKHFTEEVAIGRHRLIVTMNKSFKEEHPLGMFNCSDGAIERALVGALFAGRDRPMLVDVPTREGNLFKES